MLRGRQTASQQLLWTRLRDNQLGGFRFTRQHPIAWFIADFYCHKAKLVIELDGVYHDSTSQKFCDEERTRTLNELGVEVVRFSDEQITQNIEQVLIQILEKARRPL